MFKSLFFLGALAPSMLSGNVPPRSLDNQPTLKVGDVYRFDLEATFISNGSSSVISLFRDDDLGFNSLSIIDNSFNISCSDPDFLFSVSIPYSISFDYSEIFTTCTFDNSINTHDNYSLCNFDDFNDYEFNIVLFANFYGFSTLVFTISFEFEIISVSNELSFNNNALPYLTKVETPYTPPAKSNLYRLLYDFYYSLFNDDDLHSINTNVNIPFDNWICHTLTIITLISLVFILFLLLRWLFKLVGNLTMLRN